MILKPISYPFFLEQKVAFQFHQKKQHFISWNLLHLKEQEPLQLSCYSQKSTWQFFIIVPSNLCLCQLTLSLEHPQIISNGSPNLHLFLITIQRYLQNVYKLHCKLSFILSSLHLIHFTQKHPNFFSSNWIIFLETFSGFLYFLRYIQLLFLCSMFFVFVFVLFLEIEVYELLNFIQNLLLL